MVKISAVINTWNEEKNLPRALTSIRNFADEIVVVDMESSDSTVEIASVQGLKFTRTNKLDTLSRQEISQLVKQQVNGF